VACPRCTSGVAAPRRPVAVTCLERSAHPPRGRPKLCAAP
jgi:hypothetical protein